MHSRNTSLSWRTLVGYGIGDFGINIYWNSLSLILVFWYADILGLPPTIAGGIYFIGLFWDAISDPIVAFLAERTRTKFGTYRPFILYGCGVLGLVFTFLFWIPPFEGNGLIIHLAVTHMIFRTCYTFVAVPYSALSSRLSFNSRDRTVISGTRMFFAFSGLLTVSLLWFPLVRFFNNGSETDGHGFFMTAFVGSSVATLALLSCFFNTRERPPPGRRQAPTNNFLLFLTSAVSNKALTLMLLAVFFQAAGTASYLIPLAFFIEINQSTFASKETIFTISAIASLIGAPVWTYVISKLNKKTAWISATFIVSICGISLAFMNLPLISGIPPETAGLGFGCSAFGVLVWSFIPDTVEYGQWKTGIRNEAAVFGSVTLVQKISGGLTGLGVGIVLSYLGYDAQIEAQSDAVVDGIRLYISIMPGVLLTLSAVVIYILPLSRSRHAQIIDELSESADSVEK
ncbi:MFS transporter [Hirschia maritima]|uniref:MFS transporter n=1 Tax=Hirschia maritima TaxID=1121961 RepID=UPI0003739E89|nr:glycoside-pentoside-hexuronide (GPH):cation symporter [Hirschia maritima]